MDDKKTSTLYKFLRWLVKLCYPKPAVTGLENLPDGPAIVVGNHAQMHGPIAGELYFPGSHYIWCAGQMMELREVPGYAFEDFWSFKPGYIRWFYKLASYLIAPLSVCLFNNAHTVPVYHDTRILTTFRQTVSLLKADAKVIIFPEYDRKYNNILYDFQDRFVDVAWMYYKKTGQELSFVPMYLAPKLRLMTLGKPIRFNAAAPLREERLRIRDQLMEAICGMAVELPEHTVIPYRNIPKREYPKSKPLKVFDHEDARR